MDYTENKDTQDDTQDDIIDHFDFSLKKKKKKKVTETISKETSNDYDYIYLLERIFGNLREKYPSILSTKKLIVPPPQLVPISSKKTMISNFTDIIRIINRTVEHVQSYFITELNTNCNIDSMSRLIIRGKYVQKHIESIFKKYMIEYVHCESCNKYNTSLLKDQITRLYFIKCNMCNSTKTVDHIKMCKY
jgi:translation initiation factor 2 subunit 2